jgi:hypothetical protein
MFKYNEGHKANKKKTPYDRTVDGIIKGKTWLNNEIGITGR